YDDLKLAQARLVQQEKLASLGRLVAGVAHELNNPISFIVGNVHALARYRERLAAYLHAVHAGVPAAERERLRETLRVDGMMADLPELIDGTLEGTRRVSDIVTSLKRLSFATAAPPERLDLAEAAAKAVQWVIKGRSAPPAVAVAMPAGLAVEGQPGQLHQVMVNLVENALDAVAARPGGAVSIGGRRDGAWVVVEVADNGPGIAAADLSKVFDPFFTTKPVGQGTGLGLWISYGIVKDHGGILEAGNGADGGARFVLTLPAG
ncbi:MAG: PAS domain-containing sensor histidine kinase, partial [Magnetospirillum sp.]|nr:PAS domain-containing sensor histidine kinase [Magnetospirillum sp.]